MQWIFLVVTMTLLPRKMQFVYCVITVLKVAMDT